MLSLAHFNASTLTFEGSFVWLVFHVLNKIDSRVCCDLGIASHLTLSNETHTRKFTLPVGRYQELILGSAHSILDPIGLRQN